MDYITLINYLKDNYSLEFLTKNQKKVYLKIKKYIELGDIVNLYGKEGVGKTFLAWVFAKENNYKYFENLEKFNNYKEKCLKVIVDNGILYNGREVRRKILLKSDKAIYITKKEIPDLEYTVELSLDSEDIEKVLKNIYPLINIKDVDKFKCRDMNLWKLFRGIVYEC